MPAARSPWPRADDPAARLTARRWPRWLAGTYLLFSLGWIFGTDFLVAGLPLLPGESRWLQSAKGVLFVVATSLLLLLLARWAVESLLADRDLLASLIASAPVGIVAIDLEGRVRLWNPEAEGIFGWSAGKVLGRPLPTVPDELRGELRDHLTATVAGEVIRQKEVRRRHRDGHDLELEFANAPVHDAEDNVVGAVGLFTDIGPRKRSEQILRVHAAALEATASAVLLADASMEVEWANRAFYALTGYEPGEVAGRNLAELLWGSVNQPERQQLAVALAAGEALRTQGVHRKRDGSSYLAELTISPVEEEPGGATHFVAVQEDVSERMFLSEQLRLLATYDPLTQLPNRAHFLHRLSEMAVEALASGRHLVLAVGRIDRFHRLRQSLGRGAADEVVRTVGARLREALADDERLAAFGGGFFALAKVDSGGEGELPRILGRMRRAVEAPLAIAGTDVYPQVTFGCAIFPRDGATVEDALDRAETALALGIEQGQPIFLFEDRLQTSIDERVILEGELRAGLARDELFLEYQPVFDLRDDSIALAEALARWRHPRHGLLAPGRFLPAADEAGLLPHLDQWVLRRAVDEWQGFRHCAGGVAVNLGAGTLEEESLLGRLEDLIASSASPPGELILEITETAAMRQPDRTMDLLRQIRDLGLRIAIDDFGVAYSSLNYLRQMPADFLKVDRSFIDGLGSIARDERLVEAILALAGDFGMEVIAEGVEQPAQLDWLRAHGCRYAQGFLLGRPGSVADLETPRSVTAGGG